MTTPVERSETVDRARLVAYAAASGDLNPIHWHELSARRAGLEDVIAHGMLTMGLATSTLVDSLDDPGRITGVYVRFARPLVVGDDVEVPVRTSHAHDGEDSGLYHLSVTDSAGEPYLTRATAEVRE